MAKFPLEKGIKNPFLHSSKFSRYYLVILVKYFDAVKVFAYMSKRVYELGAFLQGSSI